MMMAEKTAQTAGSKPKKRRTQAQKVGRLVYISQLEERILKLILQLLTGQCYMIDGLSIGGYLVYDKPFVEHVVCRDDFDKAILVELHHAGYSGVLPKDIANALRDYELNRFQVLRRIQHMNKLLEERMAKKVAEKHGHKWALTEFTREAYDKSKGELSQKEEDEVLV
jgi:hypothetical protein